MTNTRFWKELDQVFDSKVLTSTKQEAKMAEVLKKGYDENLNILGVFMEQEPDQVHQMYVNLDEENPLTVGNRFMLCYTSDNRAIYDTHAPLYPPNAMIYELPVREMLNNVFNKRVIGGLVFNRYLNGGIIVRKTVLERYIKGDKPLPENFVDVPMPYPLQHPHGMEPYTPEMLELMKQVEEMFAANPKAAEQLIEMLRKGPDGTH